MEATLTSKGQVTLPIAVRRKLGLEQGDKLFFEFEEDGRLLVSAPRKKKTGKMEDLIGCLKWDGPPKTLEDMERAIEEGAVERYRRAVAEDA